MNKRIFSFLTALAMVTSMASMTVSAEIDNTGTKTGGALTDPEAAASTGGSVTVGGEVEDIVEKEVFSVLVPVMGSGTSEEIKFTMDPQELIEGTKTEILDGSGNGTGKYTYGKGAISLKSDTANNTLLFPNYTANVGADGKPNGTFTKSYSNTTDQLVITNKSSYDVDVTVSAKVTDAKGLSMSKTADFGTAKNDADDKAAHLYLAVQGKSNEYGTAYTAGSDDTTAINAEADGIEVKSKLDKVPTSEFETIIDNTGGDPEYKYQLMAEPTTGPRKYSAYTFVLTGATNPNAEWDDLDTAAPAIDLVWKVTEHVDPYITAGEEMSVSAPDMDVTLDSAAMTANNATLTSITTTINRRSTELLGNATYCSVTGDKYTFTGISAGAVLTFTFSDGRTETITVGA